MDMLKSLLSSKKAIATLVAVLVWVGGRFGLDLTLEEVAVPVAAIIGFVLAQGWADGGKEAAKVTAAAKKDGG